MIRFNAISRFTRSFGFVGGKGAKLALAAAVAVVVAALLGDVRHSEIYADSPTETRASQSPADASQALRRYTLQLLNILSNPDANQWERHHQAIAYCDDAPTYLDEIGAGSDVSPLDSALIALTEDLCGDLGQRLDEARTVGLLMNEPESIEGYTLIPGLNNIYVHLIDHLGRVAHSWQNENLISHAKLLDNGNLLIGIGAPLDGYSAIAELDPESNVVWKYTHPDGFHHDFLKMPNGNILILAQGLKTQEETIAAGVNPHMEAPSRIYDYLIEVRPTGSEGGEIVWEWSTWDYLSQDFDASKENYADPSQHPELIDVNYLPLVHKRTRSNSITLDWLHTNAIDYNPELDQIALSPRHYSELWIIDHSAPTEVAPTRAGGNAGKGGALLYRWGNPRAYRHGTVADQRLFFQHHTHWIAPGLPGEGNILIFNNGYELGLGEAPPFYSSIEEIVPPVDGYGYRRDPGAAYPPAEPVWRYTAETPTDFYSRLMSGAQRLPNGNTLICEGMQGNVFQVTPDGKTVWQYVYPMDIDTPLKQGEKAGILHTLSKGDVIFNNAVYRAYWYAPDYPGLQKHDLTPGDAIEIYE